MQDQTKERLATLQREINANQTEMARLTSTIETRETDLSHAAISSQLNNEQRLQLEEILRRKDSENKRLRDELDQTRRSLDTLVLTRRAEGTA